MVPSAKPAPNKRARRHSPSLPRGDEVMTERLFSHPLGEPMACFIVSKALEHELLFDNVILDLVLALQQAIDGSAPVAFLIFPFARSTNFDDIVIKIGEKLAQHFPYAHWANIGQMMFFGLDRSSPDPEVFDPSSSHPAIVLELNTTTIVATCWSNDMPIRTRRSTLQDYASLCSAEQSADLVVGGYFGDHPSMVYDNLASSINCQVVLCGQAALFLRCCMTRNTFTILSSNDPSSIRANAKPVTACSDRTSGSDEHPVSHLLLQPRTPLWDSLLDSLNALGDHQLTNEIIDFFSNHCFKKDLRFVDERGNWSDSPVSLSWKMEVLLQTVTSKREAFIRQCIDENIDLKDEDQEDAFSTSTFSEEDMKRLMNEWLHDIDSWMNANTRSRYNTSSNKQQIRKRSFSSYLQYISGCKFMLRKLIQLPLLLKLSVSDPLHHVRVAQPDLVPEPNLMGKLIDAFHSFKQSPEYHKLVADSEKHTSGSTRLGKRIWQAQQQIRQGANFSYCIGCGDLQWSDMPPWQRQFAEKFETGNLKRALNRLLDELLDRQLSATPGVVATI